MNDILEDSSVPGQITFIAETNRGLALMGKHYHEGMHRFATNDPDEREAAERFKKDATKTGITIARL